MKKPLRIIQVGAGSWGWSWIDIVNRSQNWELSALVDIDKNLLKKACDYYNLNTSVAFGSLKEAADSVGADAVLVVVPPEYHKVVALEAFECGLHCIIEKPLAPSIKDSMEIVDAARQADKKLMVSQNYRFKRAPQTVKEALRRDIIGEIGTVYVNFQKSPPFTGFRTEMKEPLITDMAVHHFDQIRGILGLEPVKITAHSWNPKWSWFKGNAIASVLFEMSNGAVVSYIGSWVSRGWETTWDGDWRIQGDGGEILWANNEVIIKPSDLFKTVFMEGALESHGILHGDLLKLPCEERLAVMAEFADSIYENREPETSGQDNLRSLAMVLGARISAESKSTVTIEDILKGFKA